MSLRNFLKTLDHALYQEYNMEYMKDKKVPAQKEISLLDSVTTRPSFDKKIFLPKVQNLPQSHAARIYIEDRHIPVDVELYFTENFGKFVNELLPNHDPISLDDSRIVIPFYDENGVLQGFQGRSLISNHKVKYITVKVQDNAKKIYGLNRVNFSTPVYVVEGPIDSMFIPNSLATMDSSLYRIIETLGQHDYVFVYDNEPRNENIIKMMQRTIKKHQKICIWPNNIKEKDINDMVKVGLNPFEIIQGNIFHGLKAELHFNTWKKV